MGDNAMLYEAVYPTKDMALADLDAFGRLHQAEVIGKYDAAVIDNDAGTPHIVKRVDRPRMSVIPEMLGGGTLKRSDLKQAAAALAPGEAALVVVGEPTIEKAFDDCVRQATKTAKQEFDQSADQLADMLTQH
ncbi:MAG: hypothetical protein JO073_12270 [Actinobacteria bacterium]|nr:hypothetical protein [Actinomycetota bacterium]